MSMKITNFETTDFQLATFLLAKDVLLLGIRDIPASKRKIFVFEKNEYLSRLVNGFWARKELIEPILLLEAQRRLKTRLFTQFDVNSNKEGEDVKS